MLDAITLERRGVPSAVVATEKLARTTGRAMARAQRAPDFPIATVEFHTGLMTNLDSMDDAIRMAKEAFPQVEKILVE
ncbi:MAG: hypothetical protein QF714_07605 [Dehalococcoidia bacterium]|nr:hypothetical protein [Dehalococcoidia bacterium]MDP6227551.1 hypothetical protein [Dehalococcoidia bacterium]MDP7082894.1 hypothetical protein [Dehalococcoidia bacterium]MDP7200111.1 hypothetical protein [Dehalococcoidia bacterium]MDP7511667.1 hypothetical protein [Dehalococcoidia bacterium]